MHALPDRFNMVTQKLVLKVFVVDDIDDDDDDDDNDDDDDDKLFLWYG